MSLSAEELDKYPLEHQVAKIRNMEIKLDERLTVLEERMSAQEEIIKKNGLENEEGSEDFIELKNLQKKYCKLDEKLWILLRGRIDLEELEDRIIEIFQRTIAESEQITDEVESDNEEKLLKKELNKKGIDDMDELDKKLQVYHLNEDVSLTKEAWEKMKEAQAKLLNPQNDSNELNNVEQTVDQQTTVAKKKKSKSKQTNNNENSTPVNGTTSTTSPSNEEVKKVEKNNEKQLLIKKIKTLKKKIKDVETLKELRKQKTLDKEQNEKLSKGDQFVKELTKLQAKLEQMNNDK